MSVKQTPSVFSLIHFCYRKRLQIFRVIGQFIAKAMLDSRIIDLSFNKTFVKLILGVDIPLTLASLQVRIKYLMDMPVFT